MLVRGTFVFFWVVSIMGLSLTATGNLLQADNSVPVLTTISRQYILEGEILEFTVTASDADGDPIELWLTSRPQGSVFTDNGDGTGLFRWEPDFTGPGSSEGSPFLLMFWAGDGDGHSSMQAEVVVTNNNRKPYIICPDTVTVESGKELTFQISGYDPDFDPVSWQPLSMPAGLSFDDGNPATCNWMTSFGDSGYYDASFSLVDSYGASDTTDVVLSVLSAEVYGLSVDTVSAYPGEVVKTNVYLKNLEAISGFNILIHFDASVLTFSAATNIGTRTESFEYFNYFLHQLGFIGDARIVGVADLDNGVETGDLEAGEGSIAELMFYVSNDLNYAGYLIPINFVFRDASAEEDNTLTDPSGALIVQEQITYSGGHVRIHSTTMDRLGDINLNGIPYEIGDVIYLTNYFINPIGYSLNPLQRLNSDVNQDGNPATVADLVFMINNLLNLGQLSSKPRVESGAVTLSIDRSNSRFSLNYSSELELGAIAMTLEAAEELDGGINFYSVMEEKGMIVRSATEGNLLRLLIYSEDGHTMPSGLNEFFGIDNNIYLKIKDVQISSAGGSVLRPDFGDDPESILPEGFVLHQNSPNPFNPTTEIRFDLSRSSRVELRVHNVLGQEIRTLVDEILPAGSHTVVWNGRDNYGNAVSSGIYFYRLGTESFSDTKKMILLK